MVAIVQQISPEGVLSLVPRNYYLIGIQALFVGGTVLQIPQREGKRIDDLGGLLKRRQRQAIAVNGICLSVDIVKETVMKSFWEVATPFRR